MPPRIPGLVVFDLDGTLVDSRRDLAIAANELIRTYGGVPLDERTVGSMIGDGVAALVERAMAAGCGMAVVDEALLEQFRMIYARHLLDHTHPYSGIRELLTKLRRRTIMAVLTNKPRQAALAILRGLELLSYFNVVIGGDSPFARKPAPDGLRFLIREAGTREADTLLVGDSIIDYETARKADTAVALARYGYGFAGFPEDRLQGDEILLDSPLELARELGI